MQCNTKLLIAVPHHTDYHLALVHFSGEEAHGRYVDLHECHKQYNNIKGFPVCIALYRIVLYVELTYRAWCVCCVCLGKQAPFQGSWTLTHSPSPGIE